MCYSEYGYGTDLASNEAGAFCRYVNGRDWFTMKTGRGNKQDMQNSTNTERTTLRGDAYSRRNTDKPSDSQDKFANSLYQKIAGQIQQEENSRIKSLVKANSFRRKLSF
jgi:hypothetical protein